MKYSYLSSEGHVPNKKHIKVSCSKIEALILSCGEAEAHSEDRQGQGEQPSKDKQDGPYGETRRHETQHQSFLTLHPSKKMV